MVTKIICVTFMLYYLFMDGLLFFAYIIHILFVWPMMGVLCLFILAMAHEVMKYFEKSYNNTFNLPLSIKEILVHYIFCIVLGLVLFTVFGYWED